MGKANMKHNNKRLFTCTAFALLTLCAFMTKAEEILLTQEGGVYHLPVIINDAIELNFVIDTGASDVHIPADVALTLIRAGTISEADFLGRAAYGIADGSVIEKAKLNLRSLQIGTKKLTNVQASIGSFESPLLLGQSALILLEPWQLASSRNVFIYGAPLNIKHKDNAASIIGDEIASKPSPPSIGFSAFVNTPDDGFLALRTHPNTKTGNLLAEIPHATHLTVGECISVSARDRWCKTSYKEFNGWVSGRYLDTRGTTIDTGWILQVASLTDSTKARTMVGEMAAIGFPAFVEKAEIDGSTYYRVCLGPEKEREGIEVLAFSLFEKTGIKGYFREY